MSFIKTIAYQEANKILKRAYNKVKGKDGAIDNILMVHSLRPHTLAGHMSLYKNVLHNSNNTVPKWFLECIGVYVSILNKCDYCVSHHFEGLKKLVNNDVRANKMKKALETKLDTKVFTDKERVALEYAEIVTKSSYLIDKLAINKLIAAGYNDGEVLEINQVVAYFNYANRTVLGLGVNLEGDVLGLSPNDSSDENNWTHQ